MKGISLIKSNKAQCRFNDLKKDNQLDDTARTVKYEFELIIHFIIYPNYMTDSCYCGFYSEYISSFKSHTKDKKEGYTWQNEQRKMMQIKKTNKGLIQAKLILNSLKNSAVQMLIKHIKIKQKKKKHLKIKVSGKACIDACSSTLIVLQTFYLTLCKGAYLDDSI